MLIVDITGASTKTYLFYCLKPTWLFLVLSKSVTSIQRLYFISQNRIVVPIHTTYVLLQGHLLEKLFSAISRKVADKFL